MSKTRTKAPDELEPDYDFASMRGGVRGKYAKRYRAGTNLALLDPDVAAAFPTDEAVNRGLRALLEAAAAIPKRKRSGKLPPVSRNATRS